MRYIVNKSVVKAEMKKDCDRRNELVGLILSLAYSFSPFSTVKSSLPSSSDSPASSSISSKRKSTPRVYLSSSSESESLVPITTL